MWVFPLHLYILSYHSCSQITFSRDLPYLLLLSFQYLFENLAPATNFLMNKKHYVNEFYLYITIRKHETACNNTEP